jgi:hypothetical protein
MDDKLVVVEQKEVEFYGDELTAVRVNDGQVYVSIRQMCQALGIKRPQRQTDRIKRDEVLNDGLERVPMMGTRGRQQTYALRVDLVPLWLAGIEASRVDDNVKDKIIRYKREVAKVLWEAFQEGRLTTDPSFEELLQSDSPAVQAYKTFQALTKLARNQILMEARLDEHEQRLEQIETQLGTSGKITPDQATAISQAVKTIARELGKQTGKNEYGGVYGELYRRYRIPSYRELPEAKYDDAIKWLGDWLESLIEDKPF